MARTLRRQPYSVSTSGKSYAETQNFVQAEFKGLSNIKNDTLVDQTSFASANNVYVDDNMLLVSRPPLKFYEGEGYIERDWILGQYKLRLYKQIENDEYVFTIKCISHVVNTPDEYVWRLPIDQVGYGYRPEATCVAIEDKVFIWFGGFDLIVFNTAEKHFESGLPHLYLPILSFSVNGIETPVESANFLTPSGRRRHQYSLLSSVNFSTLVDKTIDINYNDTYLYSQTLTTSEPCLIKPALNTSIRYHYDIAQGLESLVYLRYDEVLSTIEVSFDGKYFEMLPGLQGILGLPQLSKDGTHVIVAAKLSDTSSTYYLYYCELLSEDSNQPSHRFVWRERLSLSSLQAVPRMHFINMAEYAILSSTSMTASTLSVAFNSLTYKISNIRDIRTNEVVVVARPVGTKLLVAIIGHDIGDMKFGLRWYLFGTKTDGATTTVDYISSDYDIGNAFAQRYGFELASPVAFDAVLAQHVADTSSSRVSLAVAFTDGRCDYELDIAAEVGTTVNLTLNVYAQIYTLRSETASSEFKFSPDAMSYITDKYRSRLLKQKYKQYYGDLVQYPEIIPWPKTPAGVERNILSGDLLSVVQSEQIVSGNIHRVVLNTSEKGIVTLSLIDGPIASGDLVVWRENTRTAEDYFTPDVVNPLTAGIGTAERLHLFTLEKMTGHTSKYVYPGDTVQLLAYPDTLDLDGVEFSTNTLVAPWVYPEAPDSWALGDPWPWETKLYPKPLNWQQSDPLPTGPVRFEGTAQRERQIIPVAAIEQNAWLQIDDELWSSLLNADESIEIDEYINMDADNVIKTNLPVPTHHAVLSTYYLSFEDKGRHLLETVQTKLDAHKLSIDGSRENLLYLPERNEQVFADKITNMWLIADNILAVFTTNAIYNITASTLDDGSIVYSAPIVSKIPAGCRDGDDVMMALDGQALLIPTTRGIAALAPQDFVATADKVMTYLSDAIQDVYDKFYRDRVNTSYTGESIDANIKMLSYRYWLILYRYMDNTILLLDTRTGVWWKWTTPYPIAQITNDLHLHLILQVKHINGESFGGVSYILKDHDDTQFTGEPNPKFVLSVKSKSGYSDDIIDNTLSGSIEQVYENEFVGNRAVKGLASPVINWHILSQKLHLNAINNYKTVKGLVLALEGEEVIKTSLTVKVYRNLYHPEQNEIMQIAVNGLRTFNHRLNLLHTINFQYKLENVSDVNDVPLKLSSTTIKYEVKEGIR